MLAQLQAEKRNPSSYADCRQETLSHERQHARFESSSRSLPSGGAGVSHASATSARDLPAKGGKQEGGCGVPGGDSAADNRSRGRRDFVARDLGEVAGTTPPRNAGY